MTAQRSRWRFVSWREVLAGASVVASLLFVGLQVRQNTIAIRGETRQALAAGIRNWLLTVSTDDELSDLMYTVQGGGEVTPADTFRLMNGYFALYRYHENVYLQVREGSLDESAFLSYGWSGNILYETPFVRWHWGRVRHRFHPNFVAAMEAEYGLGSPFVAPSSGPE